jgi:large subunit ribosomal protein L25
MTTLQIHPRTPGRSQDARALRRAGLVPGVLYGQGREPLSFQVAMPDLRAALGHEGGRHGVITLSVVGENATVPAVLKEFQRDKVRDRVSHLDFLAISLLEKLTTTVPVHIEGEAPGTIEGGVLDQPVHEVEVEALPGDLPEFIHVDVSALELGHSIKLSDIEPPAGVSWVSDPDTVVAAVLAPTTMEDIEAEQAAEAEAAGLTPQADDEDGAATDAE